LIFLTPVSFFICLGPPLDGVLTYPNRPQQILSHFSSPSTGPLITIIPTIIFHQVPSILESIHCQFTANSLPIHCQFGLIELKLTPFESPDFLETMATAGRHFRPFSAIFFRLLLLMFPLDFRVLFIYCYCVFVCVCVCVCVLSKTIFWHRKKKPMCNLFVFCCLPPSDFLDLFLDFVSASTSRFILIQLTLIHFFCNQLKIITIRKKNYMYQ